MGVCIGGAPQVAACELVSLSSAINGAHKYVLVCFAFSSKMIIGMQTNALVACALRKATSLVANRSVACDAATQRAVECG